MNATLSRVSPFGIILVGKEKKDGKDNWINVSKFDNAADGPKAALANLKSGDSVEYEINTKGYLSKLAKIGSVPAEAQSGSPASSSKSYSPADNNRGARQTAVNAAFGEPLRLLASAEGTSVEEALEKAEVVADRLARFVSTGSFNTPDEDSAKASEAKQ